MYTFRKILAASFFLILPAIVFAQATSPKLTIDIQTDPNPWTHLNIKDDPDNFQFAIVTDRTGGVRPGIFEDAVTKLNLLQPEFVMSVGDLIMGGVQEQYALDRQWDEFIGFVHELEMPFFYLPGNHDIYSEMTLREWRKRFGRDYYHFVYRDVLFLCLNSEDPKTHIGETQTEYAKEVLAKYPDVRWTLVFLHKPLWAYEEEETRWETVEELLVGRKHTVYAGHWHQYVKYERNDSKYFVLATTGGGSGLQGPVWGQFDHVVWITMTDEGPVMANLMLQGIWDENIRTEDIAEAMNNMMSGRTVTGGSLVVDSLTFAGAKTKLKIENTADAPLTLEGTFRPHPVLRPEPAKLEIVVPPNSIEWLDLELLTDGEVPVELIEPLHTDWTSTYEFPRHEKVELAGAAPILVDAEFPIPEASTAVRIDGDPSDWGSFPYVCEVPAQISRLEYWTGPGDASFRFALRSDTDFLYLGIQATDEFHRSDPKRSVGDKDGLEILIDSRPDPERSHGTGENLGESAIQIQLSPGATAETQAVNNSEKLPTGAQIVSLQTETGHFTEVALPHTYLNEKQGKEWEKVRLSLSLYDRDEEGRTAQIWWRPSWESPANYVGSGTFKR